jgi:hypothetical protein
MTNRPYASRLLSRPTLRLVVAAGAVFPLALATGCNDQEAKDQADASLAIDHGARQLEVVHVNSVHPAERGVAEQQYEETISLLSPIAGKGLDGQQAASNALLARSHAGLASLHLHEITGLESRVRFLTERIRTLADGALRLEDAAEVIGEYDPTTEFEILAEQREQTDREIAVLRRSGREVDAQLATLEREMAEERSAYETLRLRADALDEEARAAFGAQNAYEIVEQAVRTRREADQHQMRVAELEARIDQVKPEQERVAGLIEQAEAYLDVLTAAEQRVSTKAQQAQAAVGEQRFAAEQLLADVTDLYAEISALTAPDGELSQAYERVGQDVDRAIRAATTAMQKNAAEFSAAEIAALAHYQQLRAYVDWQHARGLETQIEALRLMESIDSLRAQDSTAVLANIDRLEGHHEQLLESATESFSEAIDTLGRINRARPGREVQAAVDGLVSELWRVRAITSGGQFPEADASRAAEEEMAAEEPIDAWPEETQGGDPLEVLIAFYDAMSSSDTAATLELIHLGPEDQGGFIGNVVEIMKGQAELDDACRRAFGSTFEECMQTYLESMGMGESGMGGMSQFGADGLAFLEGPEPDWNDFDVEMIDDDRAVIRSISNSEMADIAVVRVDGRWLIDFAELMGPVFEDQDPAMMAMMEPMLARIIPAMARLTEQVRDGEFDTCEEVAQAFMQATMSGG